MPPLNCRAAEMQDVVAYAVTSIEKVGEDKESLLYEVRRALPSRYQTCSLFEIRMRRGVEAYN